MRHFKTTELSNRDYFSPVEFDCQGDACAPGGEEAAPGYEIVRPVTGCYVRRFHDQYGITPSHARQMAGMA